MIYHIYQWMQQEHLRFPGMGLFQFITFRSMLAVLLSLTITMVYGKRIINLLLKLQVGETVRELGLQGEEQKKGTPTMGGFIILLGILVPTLLFANLDKVYIKLLLLSSVRSMTRKEFIDDLKGTQIPFESILTIGLQQRKQDTRFFDPVKRQ